jgi:hypothetical protein
MEPERDAWLQRFDSCDCRDGRRAYRQVSETDDTRRLRLAVAAYVSTVDYYCRPYRHVRPRSRTRIDRTGIGSMERELARSRVVATLFEEWRSR